MYAGPMRDCDGRRTLMPTDGAVVQLGVRVDGREGWTNPAVVPKAAGAKKRHRHARTHPPPLHLTPLPQWTPAGFEQRTQASGQLDERSGPGVGVGRAIHPRISSGHPGWQEGCESGGTACPKQSHDFILY